MKKVIPFTSAIALVLLLSACGASKTSSGMAGMNMTGPKPTPKAAGHGYGSAAPDGGSFLSTPVPAAILNTPLVDSNGKSITLASLKGKTVVISDFLTSCHEICPMTTANMREIGDAVNASSLKEKVKVLEVTVDPGRDTPSRLTAYQSLFGDTSWTLATGTDANLKTFWGYFGAAAIKSPYKASELKDLPVDRQTGKPNTYDVSHTDLVVIVDASGNWAWVDLGNPNPGKGVIPAKLKKYLSEDGLNNLAKPQEPSWDSKAVLSALSSITGTKLG